MDTVAWIIVAAIIIVVLFGGYSVYGRGGYANTTYAGPGYGPGLGILGTILVVALIVWVVLHLPGLT
jgi:hypothetical protein